MVAYFENVISNIKSESIDNGINFPLSFKCPTTEEFNGTIKSYLLEMVVPSASISRDYNPSWILTPFTVIDGFVARAIGSEVPILSSDGKNSEAEPYYPEF